MNHPPSTRNLLQLFMVAVLLRLAIFLTASILFHIPFEAYTNRGDGESYKRYTLALLGRPTELTKYDTRIVPGFPLLIAGMHLLGIPVGIAGLMIDFLSTGAAASLAAKLFRDLRIGWAMVTLIPHYVINSSLVMSEAPMLAVTLAALVLGTNKRAVSAGLLLGFAMLIRPMAGFAAIAYGIWTLRQRALRQTILSAAATCLVLFAAAVGLRFWFGDAFHWARVYSNETGAYNGHLLNWPFGSLIMTPVRDPSAMQRVPYIWAHVLVTLFACILLIRRHSDPADAPPIPVCPWLLGNTVFVLCIGSHWGFDHFPRFTIPAEPAMFYALRSWLPRSVKWWAILLAAMFIFGVLGVHASP